ADRFPGAIAIEELATHVRTYLDHHQPLKAEFGDTLATDRALIANLAQNPIAAWTGGAGGPPYFQYAKRVFSSAWSCELDLRATCQELTRELAEWRLAEYQDRQLLPEPNTYTLKVSHAGGTPLIFLPDRATHPGLPEGWTPVLAEGVHYQAN